MQSTRTGGMTAMAILNIIFGSLGAVVGLLFLVMGGVMAAGSAAMEAELGAEAEGLAEIGAMGGAIMAIVGIIFIAVCVALFVAGIGLIKMAPWGRTLSIVCGISLIGVNVLFMLFGGIGGGSFIGIGYGIILTGLCFSASWKQAYSGHAQAAGSGASTGDFDASLASASGFAGIPMTSSPAASDPMAHESITPPSSTPNSIPMNEEATSAPGPAPAPAPGFASMPGIPSAPAMPESSFDASSTSHVDGDDDTNDKISDVAA